VNSNVCDQKYCISNRYENGIQLEAIEIYMKIGPVEVDTKTGYNS